MSAGFARERADSRREGPINMVAANFCAIRLRNVLGDVSSLASHAGTTSSRCPRKQVFRITGQVPSRHRGSARSDECVPDGARRNGGEQPPPDSGASPIRPLCEQAAAAARGLVAVRGPGCAARGKHPKPFRTESQQRRLITGGSSARPDGRTARSTLHLTNTDDGWRRGRLTVTGQRKETAGPQGTLSSASLNATSWKCMTASFSMHRSGGGEAEESPAPPPGVSTGPPSPENALFEPVRVASYVPQPLAEAAREKKFSKGKPLVIFLLCTCFPVVLLAALFASIVETRRAEQRRAQQALESAEDYLRAAQDLVGSTTLCYCLQTTKRDGATENAVYVEPHLPEARLLRLPETAAIHGMKGNALTDLLLGRTSDFSLPFNFIHFAVAHSSPVAASIRDGNKISLLYVQPRDGATLLLSGFAAVVLSNEQRRHYWRSRWEAWLPGVDSEDYVLVKFVPDTFQLNFPPRLALGEKCTWGSPVMRRLVTDTEISWVLTKETDKTHDEGGPPRAS